MARNYTFTGSSRPANDRLGVSIEIIRVKRGAIDLTHPSAESDIESDIGVVGYEASVTNLTGNPIGHGFGTAEEQAVIEAVRSFYSRP